jgi:hypothetical protein
VKYSWSEKTRGGSAGHRLRRAVHVLMFVVPWIYDGYGTRIAHWFFLTPSQFVLAIASLVTLFEALRLWKGWVLFGQRMHEKKQLSSFFWGVISIALVLTFAPNRAYYIPIITVCAWVDPLVGELRSSGLRDLWVFACGLILAWLIWLLAAIFLGSSLVIGAICGLLAVYFERFNWRYIDDNALMQLAPLLFYVLFLIVKMVS